MSKDAEALFKKYEAEAAQVTSAEYVQLKIPLVAYVRESHQIVQSGQAWWEQGPEGQPGLRVAQARYARGQLDRLEELIWALGYASTLALLKPERRELVGPLVQRAEALAAEIGAACEFALDDGVQDEDDDALAAVEQAEDKLGRGAAAQGQLMLAWAELGRQLGPKLGELDDWQPALVDEAQALGEQLLRAAEGGAVGKDEAAHIKRVERGLIALVHREMKRLRQVASYVWRNHPATRQRFFSAQERQVRARQRVAKRAREAAEAN